MTSVELYQIYTEIDAVMKEHHLKDALPRLEVLKLHVGKLYHDVKDEEQAIDDEDESSEDEVPTPSDEEFVAADDSIEYDSSDSSSDSDSHEEACNCTACITA